MTDFTFMKTGFDMLQPDDDEFEQNTAAIIVIYAEHALRTAALYVTHHKTRKGITPEDIKRAMMLEMFLFKKRANLLEKAEEIKKILFEDDSDDEEPIEMAEEDEFSENSCDCAICKCVNDIYTRWDKWTPESLFEKVIKKHIDNI